ncbi:MAG: dienelactone hydrolase family protein [Alphaproteobacteria bacterium]
MSEITIPASDGWSFLAYVAIPAKTPAPVVILIHEIFGVNGEMQEKCNHMAGLGYVAVAPDLFWRIEPGISLVDSRDEELQRAFELFGLFDVEKGIEDLKSTLAFMKTHETSNGKIGCMGYCLGGKLAYMMACRSDVDVSVGYYGVSIETMLDEARNIKKPLLLHIAEEDQFVPKDAQGAIKSGLAANKNVTMYSYPNAEHAFARGSGMHYDEKAATTANARTQKFLSEHLK